jgi:ABC-type nitrate/sulfonate/bicarbonate transport system substrate-binding protein
MRKVLVCVLLIAVMLSPVLAQGAAEAEQQEGLRKVRMVLPADLERLEDTPYWAAIRMGYFEEEGLDVEMMSAFGTTDAKMVATGNAEFAAPGPMFLLASIEEGLPVKVVCAYDAINIWGMCVLKDSFIKDWSDMKDAQRKYGRKLTVALGDASWEMLVTPTLVAAGVDPKKDIEWVVAGENRYIQVAEGNLDMLFSWPGEAWQLIGQGFDFVYIDGNEVLKTNSNSIITSLKMIEEEPEVVEGFCRGLAKGIYFTKYNSEAAAALSCDQWPNIDVTWKAAYYVQEGRNYQMFGPPGGEEEQKLLDNIGYNWPDKWQLNVDVAVSSGVIDKPIALDRIFTNEFYDDSWDRSQVEADADSYDVEATKARYAPE